MKHVLGLLMVLVGIGVSAQELPEWIYVLQDDRILVAAPEKDGFGETIPLSRSGAVRLHPTPGGKYVFVTFRGANDVAVVNAENHEQVSTVSFDFEPAYIQFSPMGEKAYITEDSTNTIRIFDHRASNFTYADSLVKGRAGAPVFLNRRGTRLYRASDDGLIFVYLKTGEIIDEVKAAGFPDQFAVAPDFRTIWGVSERDGELIIVDEGRGRISRRVDLDGESTRPVFTTTKGVILLRDKLALVQTRNYRVQERIDLQREARRIVISKDGTVWSMFDTGVEILPLSDGSSGAPRGAPRWALIELDSPAVDISLIVVKSGEGFACF